MPSSTKFEVRAGTSYINKNTKSHNQGVEVFFIVDIYELFGVDINTPGIKGCLNKASFFNL